MLKFFMFAGAALGVVILGLVAYASTRPDSFSVSRSLVIKASPEKLFGFINDMRRFNEWNPFERKDPGKGIYSGPASGIGAHYAWESAKLGTGAMTITHAVPGERVQMDLAFLKPFKADNIAEFTLTPTGDGTTVTWSMRGDATLVTKVMDVVIGMDKMVGTDFAQGLANLRTLAEG